MLIETTNLFCVSNFNVIGGVETFIYELTKKYKDLDITVLYRTGHINQIARISKNVRIIKYNKKLKIKCKKAFVNYSNDLIDIVDAEEYIKIIHALYKTQKLHVTIDPRINKYIAVSNAAAKEFEELTGIKCEVIRNPLTILETDIKPIVYLVSATRLTKEKGKSRMEILGNLLNEKGINYLWLVFTNDTESINNPNIVYLKPRLNVIDYIYSLKGKCYGVQLSDCEGDCYFTRECESLGIPLLVTPVESFKEQGLVDGLNCYYLPFDMKNIDIDKIVNNIPEYKPFGYIDQWDKELINVKSKYKEVNMKVKVKCIRQYYDVELKRDVVLNEELTVSRQRADQLLANPNNIVELVEYIEEKPIVEKAVPPTKKVVKRKK